MDHSLLIYLGKSDNDSESIVRWLADYGWRSQHTTSVEQAVRAIQSPGARLAAVGSHISSDQLSELVGRVRAMTDFSGGTPIMHCCSGGDAQGDANATLHVPLDKADTLAMIEQWTGPLADHAFRMATNPRYRLVRMMGQKDAQNLFDMFVQSMEQGIAALQRGEDVSRIAHNLAGMAGMLGYSDLNAQWSAVSQGQLPLAPAIRSTDEFLQRLAPRHGLSATAQ